MSRLVWLTDPHFNFVSTEEINRLAAEIQHHHPRAVLIGGDLGEADFWESYLHQLEELLECPLYFVLGNHDYYRGSISEVRERARELTHSSERLKWLPAAGLVLLDNKTALVGHGGWGDARAGNFRQSTILINDYFLIAELRDAAMPSGNDPAIFSDPQLFLNEGLERQLQELGDEAARHFRTVVPEALAQREHVIVLMHVPPFREACLYKGHVSDDNWAPHFCCVAAGEALAELMKANPKRKMTVLCGHTHGEGFVKILPNLTVRTGGVTYGQPQIQSLINTDQMD